jgi:hypothetical protein
VARPTVEGMPVQGKVEESVEEWKKWSRTGRTRPCCTPWAKSDRDIEVAMYEGLVPWQSPSCIVVDAS